MKSSRHWQESKKQTTQKIQSSPQQKNLPSVNSKNSDWQKRLIEQQQEIESGLGPKKS